MKKLLASVLCFCLATGPAATEGRAFISSQNTAPVSGEKINPKGKAQQQDITFLTRNLCEGDEDLAAEMYADLKQYYKQGLPHITMANRIAIKASSPDKKPVYLSPEWWGLPSGKTSMVYTAFMRCYPKGVWVVDWTKTDLPVVFRARDYAFLGFSDKTNIADIVIPAPTIKEIGEESEYSYMEDFDDFLDEVDQNLPGVIITPSDYVKDMLSAYKHKKAQGQGMNIYSLPLKMIGPAQAYSIGDAVSLPGEGPKQIFRIHPTQLRALFDATYFNSREEAEQARDKFLQNRQKLVKLLMTGKREKFQNYELFYLENGLVFLVDVSTGATYIAAQNILVGLWAIIAVPVLAIGLPGAALWKMLEFAA